MALFIDPLVILTKKDKISWGVYSDDPASGIDGETIINSSTNTIKVWYNSCWNEISIVYSGSSGVNEQLIIDDRTTDNKTYFCQAPIGTSPSSALWKAWVVDEEDGIYKQLYADGNSNYDNVADNRATLTYSEIS